ncbi:MAG: phosphoribosylanthranilate isomerase [Ignavibacteriales bacterium]|nr:phosphoribosylanthranilate isomerase [Ignavibacteriales bacterium]
MQELFVKICGITNLEDAQHAVRCKADAVGFIFHEESPRFIPHNRAAEIVKKLPEHVSKIGVFVNADRKFIHEVVSHVNLSAVQLYGNEGPDDLVNYEASVIKVFRVKDDFDVEVMRNYIVDAFLLDTHKEGMMGGTGKTFNWNLAVAAKEYGKIILSGGLTPDNIEEAIRFVQPYGVDVSSGVEASPGKKDSQKVREFIMRAKSIPLHYNQE